MDPDSANRLKSFPGANDGASGVAVLMEVARALRQQAPSIGVDLALFDGEDAGHYGEEAGWCLGSQYFAAHMPAKYEWAILVDLVGDRDLQLFKEGYSVKYAAPLVEKVWKAAAAVGETAFRPERGDEILDDHMPLLARGLQAIDIIDYRYPHWHTSQDTPDKCAPASLAAVGHVLLHIVYSE
jgi:Zn-dependent M28 family amino/carboxypeptidase